MKLFELMSLQSTPRIFVTLTAALFIASILFSMACDSDGTVQPGDDNVYYVAPDGNDSNPGTESQPWRTIGKAAATLTAGETVYIKNGTYNEMVVPANSGTSGNYITYAAYAGHAPRIDGSGINVPYEAGLVDFTELSYIKISGIEVFNSSAAGIQAENAHHLIIEKNYTYNTVQSGIGIWGCNNVIIDGNEVELACNDGEQECITVAGTDTFEIRNNEVHHSGPGTEGGEGIDAKDGAKNGKIYGNYVHHINRLGIYVDAWDKLTENIEVYNNRIHDCKGDGIAIVSEFGGLLKNVDIYNNIAYANDNSGIVIGYWGEQTPTRPVDDVKIINNTCYDNGKAGWGGGIYTENPDAENVVFRNNICSDNLTFQIMIEPGVPTGNYTVDHNLIDGFRGETGEIHGTDYVEGDPKFVNAAGADFHLQSSSPAINAGSATDAPATDYDGNSRPSGGGFDIGAFEYVQ